MGRTAAPREKGAKTKAAEFTEIRKLGRKNYSIKQRPASMVVIAFCAVLLFYTGMESFPAYSFCLMYIGREPLDIA
ncbi:hypothetical protein X929_01200 [Petrotoga olearia DSM 13574]|uniref:Uncharacterized protein n=1 Tax=Petrotoga olearia DSM 13574 TaxID=1122955 RepID=A0A2K1P5Q1_9BACT|nr:hypothetical protein X929_01200 [Petrotoga olearia DSM 13574]